jgi:hypothetical protein
MWPQHFQSRIPLVGYQWYSSRLNMFRPSGFISDDSVTLPDRMGYNPAKHVIFNQIHFPDTRVIVSGWIEQRSSPSRHGSR